MKHLRPLMVAIGALLLLALALIIGGVLLWQHFTVPSLKGPETPEARGVHLSMTEVTRLEHALNSSDMRVQATVLVPDLVSIYLQQDKPMVPAGATIAILLNTEVCRNMSCKVNSVVTEKDGKKTTFILYLDDGSGQWLIADTYEVR